MPREHVGRDRDGSGGRLRRGAGLALVAGLGLLAFLVSLIATLPVRLAASYVPAPAWINGYSGTLWHGTARIEGGHAAQWRVAPLRSLVSLGVALDVRVTGPGTDLEGRAAVRGPAGHDLRIDGLTGRAAWPLVAAVAPGLDLACDGAAVLQDVAIRFAPDARSGAGSVRSGPASCLETGGDGTGGEGPVQIPALAAGLETVADGLAASLTPAGDPDTRLAEARATGDGRLVVTVSPAGAALVPGMPSSGETVLEYPFPWPLW